MWFMVRMVAFVVAFVYYKLISSQSSILANEKINYGVVLFTFPFYT